MAIYAVKNRWGGQGASWHDGGSWVLGCRPDQTIVALELTSDDNGATLNGTMTYEGEGHITVKATQIGETLGNNYSVQVRWGGEGQPFHDQGNWIIGGRTGKRVVALNVTSSNSGSSLEGTMTYEGEGHISIDATLIGGSSYTVENRWGGDGQPWHLAGTMILGTRSTKKPVSMDISSNDGGVTFTGKMTYSGEGHISFRAELTSGNNYNVQNRWGGEGAPWHDGGVMVIGCRDGQNCIALNISSNDGGETLTGKMRYDGEGDISFEGALSSCTISTQS